MSVYVCVQAHKCLTQCNLPFQLPSLARCLVRVVFSNEMKHITFANVINGVLSQIIQHILAQIAGGVELFNLSRSVSGEIRSLWEK